MIIVTTLFTYIFQLIYAATEEFWAASPETGRSHQAKVMRLVTDRWRTDCWRVATASLPCPSIHMAYVRGRMSVLPITPARHKFSRSPSSLENVGRSASKLRPTKPCKKALWTKPVSISHNIISIQHTTMIWAHENNFFQLILLSMLKHQGIALLVESKWLTKASNQRPRSGNSGHYIHYHMNWNWQHLIAIKAGAALINVLT